ncbi:MAG TPA: hypothetical protein VMS17_19150 [Gemmataceae bacterium]|nr:hypothetical protein [Gemmataceae bacterium]
MGRAILLGGLVLALPLCGCSFGPRALEGTHGRYNETVRRVYEEQLLLNIVHQRYDETPTELDVSAIAAQYELSGQAEARPFFIAPNPSNSNVIFKTFTSILPDASLAGANRPTITYTPDIDDEAIRAYLTPASADTILFLSQSTGSLSTILRLWAERLNGVPAEPDGARFQRAVQLLQSALEHDLISVRMAERSVEAGGPLPASAVAVAGAVDAAKSGLEVRPGADGKTYSVYRKERRLVLDVSGGAENAPELQEFEEILNLQKGRSHYELTTGLGGVPDPLLRPRPSSDELRTAPRSLAEVVAFLANGVDVPPEHFQCGVARPRLDADGQPFDAAATTAGLFAVHVCKGCQPPPTAYVAVHYRDHWYYIDDRDGESKQTFELLLQFSRLDFGRRRAASVPVLTLPAGR